MPCDVTRLIDEFSSLVTVVLCFPRQRVIGDVVTALSSHSPSSAFTCFPALTAVSFTPILVQTLVLSTLLSYLGGDTLSAPLNIKPLERLLHDKLNTMLGFKARFLVLSLLASLAKAEEVTGRAEVDVIFPRNDTFEPMPLMPVVFAVQNPGAIGQLYPTLQYWLAPLDSPKEGGYQDLRIRDLPPNETTAFLYRGIANTVNTERMWEFSWHLRWTNCSTSDNGTAFDDEHTLNDLNGFHRRTYNPLQSIIFTTRKGGLQPNLTALSTGEDCGKTQALGFDVKQYLSVPARLSGDGVTSCALLASPAPTPSPCKASVESEAASSISSSLTSTECRSTNPAVSCPPKDDGAAALGAGSLVAWVAAGSAWVMYNLY
ncbi:hypothetical protein JDV02_003395 [Purpureocillium takamizusanense]|uniref:DUF7136 domain-containing protein n=1 Tax=Purpureocillium takamizusanense TaxID=2060973 RepID=A0A9Q8V8E3_9HYPO|nr:uncharacterized protein JDV02_003395 [Purpureocillium takamizusanense]UNI17015.1 hypothetical protein JDV02_003395 [Purpureocillium takamizusanense]